MKEVHEKLQQAYLQAHSFLLNKVGEKVLSKELEHYTDIKIDNIQSIYKRFLESLKNRQGYKNFIAPVNDMGGVLYGYNSQDVYSHYHGDWKALYSVFEKTFKKKYKFEISNPRNSWVIYTKGVMSGAEFFSNFNEVKDFTDFVNVFLYNEYTIAALPMVLEKELFGFGFPLACDLLKELGFQQYGKPDVHIKDIFIAQGIAKYHTDYEIFKTLVKMAHLVEETPVVVDKIYWLIGSGRFEKSNLNLPGLKKEFIMNYSM